MDWLGFLIELLIVFEDLCLLIGWMGSFVFIFDLVD